MAKPYLGSVNRSALCVMVDTARVRRLHEDTDEHAQPGADFHLYMYMYMQ